MKDINLKIGIILKRKRVSESLTGSQLATKLNISQQQVSRYENGKNSISINMLIRYCSALNVKPNEILKEIFDDMAEKNIPFIK